MKRLYNEQLYQEYLRRGNWKCDKSPSGAHLQIIDDTGTTQKCKHCGEVRDVPTFKRKFSSGV